MTLVGSDDIDTENSPGYSGRKGPGLFVAVLTPVIGPVQVRATVNKLSSPLTVAARFSYH